METFVGLKRIRENTNQSEVQNVCQALIKILDNIIENPTELAKRQIKLDSEEVSTHLMPISGGMETLFEIGFEEDDEYLTLPLKVKSDIIQILRNELESINNSHEIENISNISLTKAYVEDEEKGIPFTTPIAQSSKTTKEPAGKSSDDKISDFTPQQQQCKTTLNINNQTAPAAQRVKKRSFAIQKNNQKFANRLQSTLDHVLLYEHKSLQEKARSVLPLERFKTDSQLKFDAYKLGAHTEKTPYSERDFLLLELMAWFKNEFFKWVNQPECDHCKTNVNMKFKYGALPNSGENIWMAGNVEVYECSNPCSKQTRFPRYNHPEKLLETRRGRCGEWANCFTLLLRSLDFDARYILDITDHVWCEVFSDSQQRWLHVDPCENIMDKPLIYEHGWKKNLSYIMAFSAYQCIDVTWRYTTTFAEVMSRRKECSENWLVKYTNKLSTKRQVNFGKSRLYEIQLRTATEIVEFLTLKNVKDGEDVGRVSGSLQWRLNRGEIQSPKMTSEFNFKLKESNVKDDYFRVQYNSVNDKYKLSDGTPEITGWKNGVSKCQNIQYKIENDWQMVYLARTNGSDTAFIEWSFDLSELKQSSIERFIKKIKLHLNSECFETGKIEWSISWSNKSKSFNTNDKILLNKKTDNIHENESPFKVFYENNEWTLEKNENNNAELVWFKICGELSGGVGQNAWQHTQIFRQKLNNNMNLFDVCFYF